VFSSWTDFPNYLNKLAQSHHSQTSLLNSQRRQLEDDATLVKATNTHLENQLTNIYLEKDDLHFKLQQVLFELAKNREEFSASESLLQTKVQTLDTALEAVKDEIARGFVDGFSAALE